MWALATREQIRNGLSPLDAVPLERLLECRAVTTAHGPMRVCVDTHHLLPATTWGVTTFDDEENATIWLNAEAWPELPRKVPRTRFTVAHELGHVVLHGQELEGLDGHAEPEHHARIEREANRFAAHLLIPDAGLRRLGFEPTTASIDVLAKRFGVSVMMATKRLDEWRAAQSGTTTS